MIRNSAWLHWLRSCFGHKNKVGTIQNRRHRSTRRIPQSAAIEGLEDRVLLAATSFNAGTLTIDFSTAGESVTVLNNGTNFTVSSTDSVTGDGTTFATNTITRLVVTDSGSSADQTLTISGSANYALSSGLNVTGAERVNLLQAISTSAADLTVVANKQIYATNSLSATDGNILLKANEQGTATGLFIGVDLIGTSVTTTGNGNVTLFGRGGDDPANINAGIRITAQSQVSGKNTTVTGIGGTSTGYGNFGVYVVDAGSEISSTGGNVSVDGAGGGTGASTHNFGVRVVFGGKITAGGAGTVTINATGGNAAGSGSNNSGLQVSDGGAEITSSGGSVSINATGTSNSSAVDVGTDGSIGTGTNAALSIIANSISLFTGASPASVSSGSGTTTIVTKSAGTLINIGGNDVLTGSPALGLAADELNLITAGTLVIGDATAGNITVSAAVAPTNVAQLELVTGGQIVDDNATGTDITVTRLGLTSAAGIGVGNPLETAVGSLEATTATGGIFISNTGNLSIGGVSAALSGVRVTSAGAIDLQNTAGNVRITTGGDQVKAPGNVSVKTLTSGNITTANNFGFIFGSYSGSVSSTAGTLTLDAAGDIDLGETGSVSFNGDVQSFGSMILTAAGNISLDDQASAQTTGNGSTITITAGGDVSMISTYADGSLIGTQNSSGGLVSIRTGAGGTFTADGGTSNPGVLGGAAGILIAADNMVLLDDLQSRSNGNVTLVTVTAGRPINLGTETSGSLSLTATEINQVNLGNALNIGDSNSGTITLSAAITPSRATLNLATGASVLSTTSSGSDITVTNLNITAPTGIGSSANPLRMDASQLSTNSAGSNGDQYLSEANSVTVLSGSSLSAGAGTIHLTSGEFRLSGSMNATAVANAGTLAGSGIINGNVTNTSIISPGVSGVGTITINGNFTPQGQLNVDLTGTAATAGVNYDQIIVNGAVDLSGLALFYTATSLTTVSPFTTVTLVQNDGQDATTPSGTADGTLTPLNVTPFRLYNNGGTGNDLVLVQSATPTTVYVDDSFATNGGQVIDDADLGTTGNQSAVYGINAFNTIAAALAAVSSGGTVVVNAGTYAEAASLTGTQTLRIGGADQAQAVTINSLATVSGTTVNLAGTSSLTIGDATDKSLSGLITGSGSLTKQGAGVVTVSGDNNYTGATTVSVGTLRVTANNGLGTTAGGTSVAQSAVLDLQGVDYTTAEAVTLQGGVLYNSSGTTTFAGDVTLTATSFISTNATLLDLKGAVLGSFGFTKEASGTLRLSNTGNSFTLVAVYSGTLQLGASGVIPDAAAIINGANIDLNGFDETVNTINGGGSITNSRTLATLTFGAGNSGAGVTISGAITGAINLVKIGYGIQYLGSANNTYTGTTTINGGILGITSSGTQALGAVGSGTIVNADGQLYFSGVTYDLAEPITLNGGTLFFRNTNSFSGPITLSSATATAYSNLANSTLTLDGVIDGDQGLANTGVGTLILTAVNTYTGPTTISGGTVVVSGSLDSASAVQVDNGGTLAGSGTIHGTVNVASGGKVSPGNSPGVLNSGSISFLSGSQFEVEVNGTTDGTFDQLNVTGTVSLGGSTLIATGTITTDLGQQIVIINNDEDDAVVGTFNNLPEGTAFLLNGVTFQISYAGGTDGNDVVLTEVVPPNDVSVTVTDDQTTPVPGGTITYTITVTNTGPFPATATSLIDNFSTKLTSASWTSTATGGATGNTASGNGDIAETLNLPVGASVIYTVTANISAAALGSLINTATVSQVGDTDSDNDTATDIDTLDNPVSIVKIYDAAEASTNGKFRVSQAEATTNDTVVSYSIGGTASNGSDYTTLTGSVTIPAGSTSVDIDVTVLNDLSVEAGETVIVTLTGFSLADPGVVLDATPGNLTATVNLTDNDTNVLTISAPSITETNADQAVTFTVTSPNAVEGGFDVVVSASNGTAGISDYVLVTTTVHFNGTADETQLVSVTIKGDTLVESNETFSVLLGTVSNTGATQIAAITTGASAVGTVTNDDTASYSISDATATEGGELSFTLSLSNPVDVATTVTVTFTDGTTSAGDFTHTPIPVTFLAGNNTAQVILVATSGDSLVEADETLTVGLALTTPLTGGRLGDTNDAGIGTITNDDTATYSISDAAVTEGGELSFTVSLSNPVDVDTTVTVTFTDGTTSTGDFTHTAVPVTFLAGTNTAQVILVSTASDNTVEGDETFTAHLALPAPLTGGRFSATTDTAGGTIVNDDFSTLTIDSPTVEEGDSGLTQLVFTVTSSAAVQNGFTAAFTVTGVTADGTDYTVVTVSPLAFTGTAGETQTIIVNVNGDLLGEANETLSVTLGTVTPVAPTLPASIVTGALATGTILNDDTVSYTITNVTASEVAGTLVFDLVADHPLDIDVTIDVTFTDGSATGPDYTSTTQHITFLAGQTTKQVTVAVNDDDLVEATETFSVALGTMTPLSGRSVDVSDTGTGTITDNDTATFTVDDVTVGEGAGALVFHLGTDKPLDLDVTITVTFTAGSATGGDTDFTSTTQQITFLAGQTSHDVIVAISDDVIVEATETFTVALGTTTELGGRSVTTSDTATGTITDNDIAVVSISKLNDGFEADSPTQGKFRITQSAVSSTDTIITYMIGGTATPGAGNDYAAVSGIATIPAGQTTVDFDVVVQDDALVESTETVIVTLTGFDENDPDITLDTTPATVNITDNDVPTFISGATANIVENTPANIVVLNVDADATLIAAGHALSYSLSGPDSALFNIDSVTGEITFVASPDFETPADQGADNVYEITVAVTADTTTAQSASQNLTITVTPVNDITPVFLDASPSFNTLENSAANTVVGTVSATDGDVPDQGLTYGIISGNESGVFAINSITGEITVANPALLDYETLTSVTLIVRVSDNTPTARTADATVEVNIINVNEDPIITIPNSTGTYHLGKLPAFVSPDATFAYPDNPNPNYAGTTLTVSIVAGRSSRDQLTIFSKGTQSGQIHTKGKKVYFGAILIGTLEGGKGSKPDLVVTFNSNATHAAVDNLLRRLNFLAKDKVGTNRTVTMQVRNLEGVDSNIATRDIAVVPRVGR